MENQNTECTKFLGLNTYTFLKYLDTMSRNYFLIHLIYSAKQNDNYQISTKKILIFK